ncbi:CDP-glycerol glycerophosphotransferase [Fibrobacter sp. UWB15]|uniref:CDP-glycerol glycerophosphotransferase family protein n=1 Tax=unclassified Fibrobacter TaxID=2634177 RepID=UPI000919B885|nr:MULTISPECIES: CDP-glycerol glycerophosphotransferase family protein [unclassified Fibrobacter]PWJ66417.1 CDP-glycerol glycerophosphotransferase [Fibrobacter sp. UWB6]SHG04312.1 CDP-glycerol glycerophosphotransferase [Fibrobacter sp. UWB8]SMG21405.1 CDP-glycerol glycerophosphotransferase [Fibrobacter sp. UWB15]
MVITNKYLWLFYNLLNYLLYCISKFSPRKKNRWVFGSWFGNQISDNSLAMYNFIKNSNPQLELIWLVRNPEQFSLDCKIVKRNSIKGMFYVATARVAFVNQGYFDLCSFNLLAGAYKVQLWHGVPWKRICNDTVDLPKNFMEKLTQWFVRKLANYDLYITPSDSYAKIAQSAFNASTDSILKVGQPRNQVLFDAAFREKSRKALLEACGMNDDHKIVVYMPTFRDKKAKAESFFEPSLCQSVNQLAKTLDFVLIEKSHYQDISREKESLLSNERVFLCPNLDAQTLLAGTDVLITDYSSCFFDFLICDRPIIHFAYDYEYYKNKDRGLYYDIEDVACGTVATNHDEVLAAIKDNICDPNLEQARRQKNRNKFIAYESNDSCKIIMDFILQKLDKKE